MITIEKVPDVSVKTSFFKAYREETMIKERKELHDIKCNDTGMTLFKPFCLNEMSKIDASISCGPLSDASKLIRVQETI